MFLRTSAERIRLLKAGLTGKEIEKLYLEKNGFELIRVSWQDCYTTDLTAYSETLKRQYITFSGKSFAVRDARSR